MLVEMSLYTLVMLIDRTESLGSSQTLFIKPSLFLGYPSENNGVSCAILFALYFQQGELLIKFRVVQ